MSVPIRKDKATVKLVTREPNGFARFAAAITRTGVFAYHDAAGKVVREYRPADEVMRADSLRTFDGAPLTNEHAQIDPRTAAKHAVGSVYGVKPDADGTHVAAEILVYDAATIEAIESGKTQLSCGYRCTLDFTPGTSPDGETYDAIQRNIVGDHVALVTLGRAGTAQLRMDDAETACSFETENQDEEISIMEELKKELATLTAKLAELQSAHDKVEAERDAAVVKADAAEKAAKAAAADVAPAVAERVALLQAAAKFEVRVDGLDNDAVRAAIVEKIDGAKVPDGKSRDYLLGRYEAAIERAAKAEQSRKTQTQTKNDAGDDVIAKARAVMLTNNQAISKIKASEGVE